MVSEKKPSIHRVQASFEIEARMIYVGRVRELSRGT
jgi:hypothetical protein